jgi:hypothetical protein
MTGVHIVGEMLRASVPLITTVPLGSIKAGVLPDSVVLPALLIRSVSRNERLRLRRGAIVRFDERVAVTVRARSYRDQEAIMKLVLSICAGWTGDMPPAERISILSGGTGPDVVGPANTFEQTQDFRVSFDAPA